MLINQYQTLEHLVVFKISLLLLMAYWTWVQNMRRVCQEQKYLMKCLILY